MNQSKSSGSQNKQSAKQTDTKVSDTAGKSVQGAQGAQGAKQAETRSKPGAGKNAAKKPARQP